jgi:hypothetical protein
MGLRMILQQDLRVMGFAREVAACRTCLIRFLVPATASYQSDLGTPRLALTTFLFVCLFSNK